MGALYLLAQNVSNARSVFVLDAFTQRPENENSSLIINYDPLQDKNHLLRIRWQKGEIEPGNGVEVQFDVNLEGISVKKCHWRMPKELRGRFLLKELKWNDKTLLKSPGLI